MQDIHDHKYDGKITQMLVKWEGYDGPNDDTWEPLSKLLEDCKEKVQEYLEKNGLILVSVKGKKHIRRKATPKNLPQRRQAPESEPVPESTTLQNQNTNEAIQPHRSEIDHSAVNTEDYTCGSQTQTI